jgi:hypothetical protein
MAQGHSCGLALVILQEAAQPLLAAHPAAAVAGGSVGVGKQEHPTAQSGNLNHAIFNAMRKTPAHTTKKSALKIAAAAAKRERKAKTGGSASASS